MLTNFPHIKSLILHDVDTGLKSTKAERFDIVHDTVFFHYPKAGTYARVQVVVSQQMIGYHVFVGDLLIHTYTLGAASHIDAMHALAIRFNAPRPHDIDRWVVEVLTVDILRVVKCASFLRKLARAKDEPDELLNGLSLTMDWEISNYVHYALRRDWRGTDEDFMCEETALFFLLDPHPSSDEPEVCKSAGDISAALKELEDEADEDENKLDEDDEARAEIENVIDQAIDDFRLFDLLNSFSTEVVSRIFIAKQGIDEFNNQGGDGSLRISKVRSKLIDIMVRDYSAQTLGDAILPNEGIDDSIIARLRNFH